MVKNFLVGNPKQTTWKTTVKMIVGRLKRCVSLAAHGQRMLTASKQIQKANYITGSTIMSDLLDKRPKPTVEAIQHFVHELKQFLTADKYSVAESVRTHHGTGVSYHTPRLPDVVVFPQNTEDVSKIVTLCSKYSIPIIPFGAGTSLEGQITAVCGGVSIDMSQMNKIVRFEPEDMDITVEAGVTREQLNDYVKETGLFFPIDPGANATLGGMTSTRASGTNAVKYGTMRECVLNLTVVLPNGSIIHTARRSRKSSAGYDLTRLFVGSEGTLGVITEVTIRLFGVPEAIAAAMCTFPDVNSAAKTTMALIQIGIPIARVEIMDPLCVRAINKYNKTSYPEKPILFFEFHGTQNSVEEQATVVQELCKEYDGADFQWATEQSERNKLWKARHTAYFASLALRPGSKGMITDVCVPISRLAECIDESKKDFDQTGLLYTLVGHVGDGNFHIVIMLDEKNPEELHIAEEANARLVNRALSMEGTVTGEHGIGLGKIPYMLYEHGADSVRLMRSLKIAVDTKNIMNPGKVFPTDVEIDEFDRSPEDMKKNLVKHEVRTAGL